mgnify:CR=1
MQNLTTIGPVFSDIICLIKIDNRRWTDTRKREAIFSYSRGHEMSTDSITILSLRSGSKKSTRNNIRIHEKMKLSSERTKIYQNFNPSRTTETPQNNKLSGFIVTSSVVVQNYKGLQYLANVGRRYAGTNPN